MMTYALPSYCPISSRQNLHAKNVGPFYILCDPSPNAIFFTLPCGMSFVVICHVENLLPYRGIFGPQILSASYGDVFMPVPVPPPLQRCPSVFDVEDFIFLQLRRCLVKWKMRPDNSAKFSTRRSRVLLSPGELMRTSVYKFISSSSSNYYLLFGPIYTYKFCFLNRDTSISEELVETLDFYHP